MSLNGTSIKRRGTISDCTLQISSLRVYFCSNKTKVYKEATINNIKILEVFISRSQHDEKEFGVYSGTVTKMEASSAWIQLT